MNALDADFQQEANEERRRIVDLLQPFHQTRTRANKEGYAADRLAGLIRAYMGLEGLTELADEERGVRAFFEERRNTKYDLRSMAQARPELVLWAAEQGYLSGNVRSIRDAHSSSPCLELDDIEGFAIPEVTTALKVEAK